MNSLSILSPSFTDSVIAALNKSLNFDSGYLNSPYTSGCKIPKTDIRETETSYIMDMELPGYTEQNIEISLKDRQITISSSVEEEKEKNEKSEYLVKERSLNQFVRRFNLPEDIDDKAVSANFKNGLLTILIPKKPEAKPIQINITAA